jgi:hypothetical protein
MAFAKYVSERNKFSIILLLQVKGTMPNHLPRGANLGFLSISRKVAFQLKHQWFLATFVVVHAFFAVSLGRLYALAPDEAGYLYTFNNLYGHSEDQNPQYNSGWITAPKIFLWISYLPAKILTLAGVPDYLSIRLLAIFLAAISLYLLKSIVNQTSFNQKIANSFIYTGFLIPSIFLWTSVGLRESFIIAEIALFLSGLNYFFKEKKILSFVLLSLGSYGLVSTKSYLWACLMAALLISSIVYLFQRVRALKVLMLLVAGLLIPVCMFASTTSVYALNFIFKSDIATAGERSGDSITQVYVDSQGSGSGSGTDSGTDSGTGSGTGSGTAVKPAKEIITFHGDYTLIALHFYLIENPNALFSKFLQYLKLDRKIDSIWNEKIQLGLVSKEKEVGNDTSSLNGHILEPGRISDPISVIWAAIVFLCAPFPILGDPGIAAGLASLESPFWWIFYSLVLFQFYRFRKVKFLRDPQIIFTLIFLAGEIAFSALVEVNLGTSFRHRSILLVPLIFLYVRLIQRASEQRDNLQSYE